MVRPLRIEYPGAWYHVMNRGRRGEQIFLEQRDYKPFLELLMEGDSPKIMGYTSSLESI
jgi:hypothetical protein